MDEFEFMDRIIEYTFAPVAIDSQLERFARESIIKTIPKPEISEKTIFFSHYYFVEKNPILEISILTRQNYLYDIVAKNDVRSICTMKLTNDTSIKLDEYFQENEDKNLNNFSNIPYKVNLNITNTNENFSYEVEGDRKVVSSLIQYGQRIIHARNSNKLGV